MLFCYKKNVRLFREKRKDKMELLRQYKRNRRQYKITETQKKMLFSYKNKVLQPLTQIFFEKRQKSLKEVPFILLKKN